MGLTCMVMSTKTDNEEEKYGGSETSDTEEREDKLTNWEEDYNKKPK